MSLRRVRALFESWVSTLRSPREQARCRDCGAAVAAAVRTVSGDDLSRTTVYRCDDCGAVIRVEACHALDVG